MRERSFARMLGSARGGVLLLSLGLAGLGSQPCKAQAAGGQAAHAVRDATPEAAIPAILKAFDRYEVVAMPAGHGEKDLDDLILNLIRDPRLPAVVNDLVVECGNVRDQPMLDRYIAGEDVSFSEVRPVWRDTTVFQMCGVSGFYEQLFPLVRALNQRLPAARRLRVVAADPPIDWSKIGSYNDLTPFFDRDGSIATVMEREVLSKDRKALMLFGVFHLLHSGGPGQGDAVTRYERTYPGRTFVISDLGYYGTGDEALGAMDAPGGVWPSLVLTKRSRLGLLGLDSFLPSPLWTDEACQVSEAFGGKAGQTIADQVDAFLYLGPPRLLLAEPIPADIALDGAYRAEWLRRMKVVGMPGPATLEELNAQIVAGAGRPMLTPAPRQTGLEELKGRMRQACVGRKQAAAGGAK